MSNWSFFWHNRSVAGAFGRVYKGNVVKTEKDETGVVTRSEAAVAIKTLKGRYMAATLLFANTIVGHSGDISL